MPAHSVKDAVVAAVPRWLFSSTHYKLVICDREMCVVQLHSVQLHNDHIAKSHNN